jgi:general secretion pathway protein L
MLEVDRQSVQSLEEALRLSASSVLEHADSLAVAIDGQKAFIRRISLPATAAKRLDEIVPFELEAQVPVDLDELLFDYRVLRRAARNSPVVLLAAGARQAQIRTELELVREALGREPERVGCGALPLANLARLIPRAGASDQAVALVDLAARCTDVVVLARGEAVYARTLSIGVSGLPDSAPQLAAQLRQTFAAHDTEPVGRVYLLGAGAEAPGAEAYLAYELGIAVERLPGLAIDGLSATDAALLPRFGKALGLALSLAARPDDLDLRRGPLGYQRGFGFVKEKAPVLSGLGAALLISFLFSTWAEMRALGREGEVLTASLETLSEQVLGQTVSDGDEARQLLQRRLRATEADPLPHADAFDVMVELSKAVPDDVTHDVEELDVQRGHVRLTGIVGTTAEAQQLASKLGEHGCFDSVKVSKVTQVINSDRQKYVLEFDIRCPQDASTKRRAKGNKAP